MGRKNAQGNSKKRKNKLKDCPERNQYEEFGEAHPLQDQTSNKRLKIEDKDECDKVDNRLSEDDVSSDEEPEDTDAVSRLLATFNTNVDNAMDSDDEEENEDDDEDSDEDEAEDSEEDEDGIVGEESEGEEEDAADGMSSSSQDGDDNHVDSEPEHEEQANENEGEDDDDDDDAIQDENDPFKKHFQLNISSDAAEEVQKPESWSSSFVEWPALKRVKLDIPKVEVKQPKLLLLASEDSESEMPNIGAIPNPPRKKFTLDDYHILKPLKENIPLVSTGSTHCLSGLKEMQKDLLAVMSNYSDLYFPEASYDKYEDVKMVYAVHALNHVLKTRKRVLKHNAKITKNRKKKPKDRSDQCYRDQGYARPKVLILLPTKHSAYRLIELMCMLLKDKNFEVLKHSRFQEEYGSGESEGPPKGLNRAEDFHEIFKGNSSEDFRIGLKLTKRTIKLYSNFFHSDMIIASPLALRAMMGNFKLDTSETDFLTSIEVLIIDQADVLMMQNWEHMLVLMEVLNKPPHDIHKLETDLTRIRMWTLDGYAHLYRQTILFSATHIDHNRALFNKCKNFTGRVQVLNPVSDGSVQEVVASAELVMIRVAGIRDPDTRFNYFIKEVLPQYQANRRIGVMVYIPDYCDYVRLIKYLKDDGGVSFASINEYMVGERPKLAKIRSLFFDAKVQFLIYTERFHFYRRYRIKGVRHVIFYDVPTYPQFFSEICNNMVAGIQNRRTDKKHIGNSTVSVLYQQSDLTKLIGVLGSQRAAEIVKANKSLHICIIGS